MISFLGGALPRAVPWAIPSVFLGPDCIVDLSLGLDKFVGCVGDEPSRSRLCGGEDIGSLSATKCSSNQM